MTSVATDSQTCKLSLTMTRHCRKQSNSVGIGIVNRATRMLEEHPHFHGRIELIDIRWEQDCLCLGGVLPSYFLKQLAQEALRDIGPIQIDNRIVVTGMIGEMFYEGDKHPSQESKNDGFRRKPK